MATSQVIQHGGAEARQAVQPRRFEFEHDAFAFVNELIWEYRFDPVSGKTQFVRRETKPAYTHRCFIVARSARQFLYHARFDPAGAVADDEDYRRLIRQVVVRDPRTRALPRQEIVIPGYAGLRQFSRHHEALLKSECGAAWRSYFLRSHWRMVFPISRTHQERTAAGLFSEVGRGDSPIVHLVTFPRLLMNHGMVIFSARQCNDAVEFAAYDPNDSEKPAQITYDARSRAFHLPRNRYWAGGQLNVIEIYRSWIL